MPIYIWKNEDDVEVSVVRTFDEIDDQPTEEETTAKGPWKRILANSSVNSKPYNGSKGYWVLLILIWGQQMQIPGFNSIINYGDFW